MPCLREIAHDRRVELDHRVAEAAPRQGLAQHRPDPPVAADDDVAGQVFGVAAVVGSGPA